MAASIAELRAELQAFPNDTHVETVCKPGQGAATCRYLAVSPGREGTRYTCEKASGLRPQIDERVKAGTMVAQGDNCGGQLQVIVDNQELLRGSRTVHREDGEEIEGTFDQISVRKGYVGVVGFGYAEDYTRLDVTEEGIDFHFPALGSATIFFEKPATPSE